MPVTLECRSCGSAFEVPPSREDSAKYCSVECSNPDPIPVDCDWCGEHIGDRKPSNASGQNFCSRGCYESHMSKEKSQKLALCCEVCGTQYQVPPHKEDSSRFCSRECKGKALAAENNGKESVTLVCETCMESFEVAPHRADTATYCSYECRKTAEVVTCHHCGGDYRASPSELVFTKYCSEECKIAAESVGLEDYGPGWDESKKQNVRQRDNCQCQDCGMGQALHLEKYDTRLHVHHIVPARKFDDAASRNDPENLITLCVTCHGKWEQVAGLSPDC